MKTTGARTSRQRGRRPGRARVRAPAHSAFGLLLAAPPARSRPAGRRLRQHVPDGGFSATHKAVRLWRPAYQKAPRSLGRAGAGTHWDQVFPRSLKPSNLREDGAKPVSHVSRTQARGGVMSSGCQKNLRFRSFSGPMSENSTKKDIDAQIDYLRYLISYPYTLY